MIGNDSMFNNYILKCFYKRASPRLKDISFDKINLANYYIQCVLILRKLFRFCKLVHADYSEYNLLIKDDKVVLIDVGSAVSIMHPKLSYIILVIVNI